MLLEKIDMLEQSLSQNGVAAGNYNNKKRGGAQGDIINQSYDSGGNEMAEQSFDYGLEENDQVLRDQIRDLQNQLMVKTEQNRELRHKLEAHQEKYNKAFNEKASVTEQYLNLKQELIDKNSEIAALKLGSPKDDTLPS